MNDNTGRELILRLTITDPKKAKWIWDGYIESSESIGVKIHQIAEGKYFFIQHKNEEGEEDNEI